jgi:hypothetical protein
MSLAVAYLVWGPLGPSPVRDFLASYRAHRADAEHELVAILNGMSGPQRAAVLAELQGVAHHAIELPAPVHDLAAYAMVAERLPHRRLCLLNSYSVILADGWLRALVRALDGEGVGIVGATGSWESQAEWWRGRLRDLPQQLLALRQARRDYPRFPNPHIRTTAFAIERELLLDLRLDRARDKRAAYLLESGWEGMTRSIRARGLRAVVVGRDGCAYDVPQWGLSRTYRSGGQENLLVADNRTTDWMRAGPWHRRRLSKDAWGTTRPASRPAALTATGEDRLNG